jgi:hypothetical protein
MKPVTVWAIRNEHGALTSTLGYLPTQYEPLALYRTRKEAQAHIDWMLLSYPCYKLKPVKCGLIREAK